MTTTKPAEGGMGANDANSLARLYAALATPYTADDAVSEPCLRSLVRFVSVLHGGSR